jgi:hypothetical protein
LKEDFDNGTKRGFANKALNSPRIDLAKGAGPDGSNAIRVAYVGNKNGSERVVVHYPLGAVVDRATLSFDVRFDKNFQWVKGGKLHGLGPKRVVTGGKERLPDGWSARIMFREDGKCETYLYDQSRKTKYGIGQKSQRQVFQAGRWYHVGLEVSLNTPGKPDGSARMLINRKKVIDTEKVVFRQIGGRDTQIQQFLFSTFHGGNQPQWAPVDKKGKPTTVYAYFDNFMITEGIQHDKSSARGKPRR